MFATILYVVVLVWFFAALGRGATPRDERLPWTRWGLRDLVDNVILGVRRLAELDQRNPMTAHRRTPFHGGSLDSTEPTASDAGDLTS